MEAGVADSVVKRHLKTLKQGLRLEWRKKVREMEIATKA